MKIKIDPFLIALVGAVAIATVLPCRGAFVPIAGGVTTAVVAMLFFLHGAKLSRQAIWDGGKAWRVHALALTATFVMFPLIGLALAGLVNGVLSPSIGAGIVFLCLLPSTVQSSIAFTAISGGNVPAAICSASASNLMGVLATPLMVHLFLGREGHGSFMSSLTNIALLLLLPFVVGHLLRRWLSPILSRHKRLVGVVDRGAILLVVYTAFSAAVVHGLWRTLSVEDLVWVLVLDGLILVIALVATTMIARRMQLSTADEIAAVFCGSKKSLASGVPMASVLFPAALVGPVIMPLMIFHQMQLMACALLAGRYAAGASRRLTVTEIVAP